MSVSAWYAGAPTVEHVALANGSETDVFTAVDNFTTLSCMTIVNSTGSGVDVQIDWYDGSTDKTVYFATVASKTTVDREYPKIPLRTGHKIKATGASGIKVALTLTRALNNERAT